MPAQAGIQRGRGGGRCDSPWIPGLATLARNDNPEEAMQIVLSAHPAFILRGFLFSPQPSLPFPSLLSSSLHRSNPSIR